MFKFVSVLPITQAALSFLLWRGDPQLPGIRVAQPYPGPHQLEASGVVGGAGQTGVVRVHLPHPACASTVTVLRFTLPLKAPPLWLLFCFTPRLLLGSRDVTADIRKLSCLFGKQISFFITRGSNVGRNPVDGNYSSLRLYGSRCGADGLRKALVFIVIPEQ